MIVKRILVIDDEENILVTIKGSLEDEGYVVETANTGERGLERVQRFAPDVVLLDVWLPDEDGIQILKKIKRLDPAVEVIVMSGHGTIETAVNAIKLGAFDFLEKPIHFEKLLLLVNHAFELKELKRENRYLREELEEEEKIIAKSTGMKKVVALVESTAPSSGWVLITGESGSGKELVARAIHSQSDRAHRHFLRISGIRLKPNNIRSYLLGDEKDPGKLSQADGGTVYFDDIGELCKQSQQELLKILTETKLDLRVVGATHRDLKTLVKSGEFIEDLFFRLSMIPIPVPPLRERKADIPVLVGRFLERYSSGQARSMSEASMKFLQSYPWPGNVRELKNWIERACILSRDEVLDLVGNDAAVEPELDVVHYEGDSLRNARAAFERHFIIKMLSKNAGNISKTAQTIGLERSYLHKKIKTYGIEI